MSSECDEDAIRSRAGTLMGTVGSVAAAKARMGLDRPLRANKDRSGSDAPGPRAGTKKGPPATNIVGGSAGSLQSKKTNLAIVDSTEALAEDVVVPVLSRDDPAFEGWMYQNGPCGIWAAARKKGDTILTKQVVKAAGYAWAGGYPWGTPDLQASDVKQYLLWVFERAHVNRAAKITALKIFSQLPRSAEDLFLELKTMANQLAENLKVELEEHFKSENLSARLGGIRLEDPDPDPTKRFLTQERYCAVMQRHLQTCLQSLTIRGAGMLGSDHKSCMLRLLILVAHIIDPEFKAQIEDVASKSGTKYKLRDVGPKLLGRMQNKLSGDHARDVAENPVLEGTVPGALNVDVARKALSTETPEGQVKLWEAFKSKYPGGVLRVKNHFAQEESATQGLRFILFNVPFTSRFITWESLLTTQKHRLDQALRAAKSDNLYWSSGQTWDATAQILKDIIAEPQFKSFYAQQRISMIAEVQLHLDFYIHARKKTHFWFKVQRADSLEALRTDSAKFRHSSW